MPTHPFEGNDGIPEPQPEVPPCPECGSTKGYSRMGPFRAHCLNCNSLLKNSEVNLSNEE